MSPGNRLRIWSRSRRKESREAAPVVSSKPATELAFSIKTYGWDRACPTIRNTSGTIAMTICRGLVTSMRFRSWFVVEARNYNSSMLEFLTVPPTRPSESDPRQRDFFESRRTHRRSYEGGRCQILDETI